MPLTELDIKLIAALAPVAGAALVALGAGFTAFFVTARIECQKQRMELAKALYLERITAAKRITELAGRVCIETNRHCIDHVNFHKKQMEESRSEPEEALQSFNSLVENFNEFLLYSQSTRWLLGEEVYKCVDEFNGYVQFYFNHVSAQKIEIPKGCLDSLMESVRILNTAVSKKMMSTELEQLSIKP